MGRNLLNIVIMSLGVFGLSKIFETFQVESFFVAFVVAFVLTILNMFVKPIIKIFALPITIMTLGLFSLVINGFIVMTVSKIVDGFEVTSFLTAIITSVLLSMYMSYVGIEKEK